MVVTLEMIVTSAFTYKIQFLRTFILQNSIDLDLDKMQHGVLHTKTCSAWHHEERPKPRLKSDGQI